MFKHMLPLAALIPAAQADASAATQPQAIATSGETVMLTLLGIGAQVYDCKAGPDGRLAWQFRGPVAILQADGKTVGHHYPGPTWELADGSVVVGEVIDKAPGATARDIPWLKLKIVSYRGSGQLREATLIRRINTKGGVASGACRTAGAFLSVPYSSEYLFLKSEPQPFGTD